MSRPDERVGRLVTAGHGRNAEDRRLLTVLAVRQLAASTGHVSESGLAAQLSLRPSPRTWWISAPGADR